MTRVAAHARTKIPRDDSFLLDKHASTRRKIRFIDCVNDIHTARLTLSSVPRRSSSSAYVPRAFPPRVQADVDATHAFVQGIFTLPGVETTPRVADFDFEKITFWQFFVMAIGVVIAGDGDVKLMYAMIIGQRNSRKGMLMCTVVTAIGNLVDTDKSAINLSATTVITTRQNSSCGFRMRLVAAHLL